MNYKVKLEIEGDGDIDSLYEELRDTLESSFGEFTIIEIKEDKEK